MSSYSIDNTRKLSEELAAIDDWDVTPAILKHWQQRAEYLETSLAQWQGEEYDLDEPLFMVQLGLEGVDLLINFILHASNSEYVKQMVPTETWKMLDEKLALLTIQISKFNQQKVAALAAGAGHANT